MNDQPLVSVVIPTYNYARYVGDTVQSILAQSYPNLEVIVINDGSTDDTLDVLKKFVDDKRLTVHSQSNQGCTNAVNNGIEFSKGDYFALCGSDDLWNRDHIRLLVDGLQRRSEAGLVFDNAEYFRDGIQRGTCGLVIPEGKSKKLASKLVSLRDIFENNWITACTFIVRREVLNRLGLFDASLYMTGDLHLLYRIAAYYPVYFVDYIGARLRIHDRNMSVLRPHYEYGVRSLEDIKEHHPDVLQKIGRRVFARKLGRKYFRLGRYYERIGEFEKAKNAYKNAFLTRRTRPRYYWSYLRLSSRKIITA